MARRIQRYTTLLQSLFCIGVLFRHACSYDHERFCDSESSLYTRGSGKRLLHFDFLRQPVEILTAADGRPRAVRTQVMQTQLAVDGSGRMLARGTGQFEEIPADLILVSIGYRSVPIPGAGFDVDRGVILHRCYFLARSALRKSAFCGSTIASNTNMNPCACMHACKPSKA